MNILTQLTLSALRPLEKLLRQKEALLAKVEQIDQQMVCLIGENERSRGRGRPPGGGGNVHGALKEKILKALQQAGQEGLHVVELAKRVNSAVPNIRVWFYSTGKKIKEISQSAPATYVWDKRGAKAKGKTKAKVKSATGKPKRS